MDLKDIIKRNLYFEVDFDGKYIKKEKKIEQEVKFYLIGKVPVVIEYKNGEREKSIISIPVEVKKNPYLRLLQGARYKHLSRIQKEARKRFKTDISVKKDADVVVNKAEIGIQKVIDSGKFMGKNIKSILIINVEKKDYEQSKGNK